MSSNILKRLQVKTLKWFVGAAMTMAPIVSFAQAELPFVMTQEAYNEGANVTAAGKASPYWDSDKNGVHVGGSGAFSSSGGWDWDDKYVIIHVKDVPSSITFSTSHSGAATDPEWYLSSSNNGSAWKQEWFSTSKVTNHTVELPSDCRYIKICYSGNLEGWMYDISISAKYYTFKAIAEDVTIANEQIKPYYPLPTLSAPDKDCHHFTGWSPSATVMPESDLTQIAQYAINQYTSNFTFCNEAYSKTFNCGSTVKVDTPSCEGYSFISWDPELPTIANEEMEGVTYTAQWSVNQYYYVIYHNEDDSTVTQLDYGTTLPALVDPTREGYTFTGWDTVQPEKMPAHDLRIKAGWDINQYELKLMSNDSTVYKSYTFDYNQPIELEGYEDPTKEGYTFKGWDSTLATVMPASDLTYIAQWEVNQYRYVVYTSETDSVLKLVDYGATLEPLDSQMRPGYTFKGWDKEQPATMPAHNVTIRAIWDINQYKLNLIADGEVYKSYTFNYNDTIVLEDLKNPTKEGYTFAGWDAEFEDRMPAKDLSYEAQWTTNKYYVVWVNNPNNAQMNDTLYYDYGKQIPMAHDPERVGYTFLGWDGEIPATMPAKNIVIKSLWEAIVYNLSFYSEEKLYLKQTYTYGAEIDYNSISNPIRTGYQFLGWDGDMPETMPAKDMKLNAKWSVNTHTLVIVYDENESTPNDTIMYEYGAAIKPVEDPEKVGYSFIGWDMKIPATMPDNSLVITAKWVINNYTLTTLVNCVPTTYTFTYGDPVVISDPQLEGYEFNGWSPAVPESMPGHNVLVIADMQIMQFDFITNIDEVSDTIQYYYQDTIAPLENPTKEGYSFTGWYPEIPTTMPAKEVKTNAIWNINSYNVCFISDGDTLQVTSYKYNEPINLPKNPTKRGYSFIGWIDEMGGQVPTNMPASNLTFNAEWRVNSYYLVTIADGDTTSKKYDFMEEVATPDVPTKKGHSFVEWNKDVPKTMPSYNDTVKALWTINSYIVTWVVEGDSSSFEYDYGEEIKQIKDPTKTGHSFAGWDKIIAKTMPDEDLVYNAEFTANSYQFFINVDSQKDSIAYDFGETVARPEDPSKVGYSFKGWLGNIPDVMPAHDAEIFALFEKDTFEIKIIAENDSIIYRYPYASVIQPIIAPAIDGKSFDKWSAEIPTTMPAENIMIEALYKSEQFQLTVIRDAETNIEFYDFGEDIKEPTIPTKEGYTFAGWDVEYPTIMPDSNVIVTALWEINSYDFVVVVEGDSTTTSYEFNAPVEVPNDPEKKGHTFVGWNAEIPSIMPSKNVTIQAQFVVDTFTFTTIVLDERNESRYTYEQNVETPAEPVREGYTFTGWSDEIPTTMPDSNVTVTAEWAINQYNVAFVVDGDTVQIDTYDFEAKVEEISVGDKEGYTFNGWDAKMPAKMPAKDLVFNAVWQVNTHNFTYVTARNTFSISYSYGDSIIVPSDPTRKGYKFLGWSDEIPATMPDKDVKVNALWEAKKYAVTLIVDGVVLRTDSIVYGDSLKIEKQKKLGHVFKGWDYEVPETMPAKNFTLTAKFVPSSKLIAWTEKQKLFVAGLPDDAEITVSDLRGRMIYRGTKREIDLPTGGIYMVKGCNQYKKLMVR